MSARLSQTSSEKVNVRARSLDARMRTLSGGNQKKGILARWLLRDLEVLIFIEPTRGIDVSAKAEIYRQLDILAKDGRGSEKAKHQQQATIHSRFS